MFSIPRSNRTVPVLTMLLAISMFAAGCGSRNNTASDQTSGTDNTGSQNTSTADRTTTTTMSDSGMAGSSQTMGGLTDANVAAIVVAANDAEIDLGKLAQSKSKNQQVKAFAKQMATDHAAVNKNAKDLAGKLNLSPQDNETSNGLKNSAKSMHESLEKMSGSAFDKAYVDNEVTYHQNLLTTIDNTLMPATQNDQLKQLLKDTRPAVVAHLDHAKKLQSQLGVSTSRQ